MADPGIGKLINRGSISVWHYRDFPKAYHGFHITADDAGCEFFLCLIGLFRSARHPARKLIELIPPGESQLSVPGCKKKHIPSASLELVFLGDYPEAHWLIREADGKLTIETGSTGLAELERGFRDILSNSGDWATGSENNALWFWWSPRPNSNHPRNAA